MNLRTLRASLGLSQPRFARLLGVSAGTYRNWETSRTATPHTVAVLCRLVERAPEAVVDLEILAREREAAVRLSEGGEARPDPS